MRKLFITSILAFIFSNIVSTASAACTCRASDYHNSAMENGFLTLRRASLPATMDTIPVCIRKKVSSADQNSSVEEIPVAGKKIEHGYKFRLSKSLDIHGADDLEVLPRIVNRKVIQGLSTGNDCVISEEECHLNLSFRLEKTWDVEVKPSADNIELAVFLKDKNRAKNIAPYGICPPTYSTAQGESSIDDAKSKRTYTFQVDDEEPLIIEIHKSDPDEHSIKSVKKLPLKVTEKEFGDKNKKTFFIRDLIENKLNANQKSGINARIAHNRDLEYWGITEDQIAEPKIIVYRLVMDDSW